MSARLPGTVLLALLWACSSEGSGASDGLEMADGADGPAPMTSTDAPAPAVGMDTAPAADPDPSAAEPGAGDDPTATDGAPTSGGRGCDDPDPAWLLCEDFEDYAGDWDSWFESAPWLEATGGDDRGRITMDSEHVHGGEYAVKMPAAAESGYQGGALFWWACDGEQRTGCPLRSYETLYFRTWLRFAEDHEYVHHFLTIKGSRPDDFWDHGTAGCQPNGSLDMSTVVDFREGSHETFFYAYHLDMQCDANCGNYTDVAAVCDECAGKGLPTCEQQPQCCWGDNLEPETPAALPVGQWTCLEMTMTANTPGEHDGSMAYWIDGELGHRVDGMLWRTDPELSLNRVRLMHYIASGDADRSNVVWFDDVVVSTEPIGCD